MNSALFDIQKAIFAVDNLNDLKAIQATVQARYKHIQEQLKFNFSVGQKVSFRDTRRARTIEGTIVKINPKNIRVLSTTNITWTVSPALLKAA